MAINITDKEMIARLYLTSEVLGKHVLILSSCYPPVCAYPFKAPANICNLVPAQFVPDTNIHMQITSMIVGRTKNCKMSL